MNQGCWCSSTHYCTSFHFPDQCTHSNLMNWKVSQKKERKQQKKHKAKGISLTRASDTSAIKARVASAIKRSRGVGAGGINVAVIARSLAKTLVVIGASHTNSTVSRVAGTGERARSVGAGRCPIRTVVSTSLANAFVVIGASRTSSIESRITGAIE